MPVSVPPPSPTGLVDARYDLVDSPLGELFVAATDRGLCRLGYRSRRRRRSWRASSAAACCGRRSTPCGVSSTSTSPVAAQAFDLSLDLRVAPFNEQVLHELARVPYGRTETYGGLAAKVGHPRAARAVGTVMNRNPIAIVLPCHRIVGANGSLTGYAGGLDSKRTLLELEGATLPM